MKLKSIILLMLILLAMVFMVAGQSIFSRSALLSDITQDEILKMHLTTGTVSYIQDTPQQTEVPLMKPCPYGYLEYRPACETVTNNCQVTYQCPKALLINLDGWGARGNGTTDLYKIANEGVSRLIKDGVWKRNEFIVISPQLSALNSMYSPKTLHVFIAQMVQKYSIDPNEVYMVGLSGGANSIYPYITNYTDVKAVVCISGAGNYKVAYKAINTRLWAFHGLSDSQVPVKPDISFNANYNLSADSIQAEHARVTIWEGVTHTGWQQVYSGQWIGKISLYDPFKEDVFDWLLK